MNERFWVGKRVLVTGHTGFKGGWLALWLQMLGVRVAGFSLRPVVGENLFDMARIGEGMESIYGDVRDADKLMGVFRRFSPEIVLHLAAQPLVRHSYVVPVETYAVNVMGTVHLLEAVRQTQSCRVVIIVTTDKCYENREWTWAYRECDRMGGHDPYSSSKACVELITSAYRRSFFDTQAIKRVAVATARAGNVIGGGDFSKDRIVPDFITAQREGRSLVLRNPDAIRPWQHVLEPLCGYLTLVEALWEHPHKYVGAWNFGPGLGDARSVRWVVNKLNEHYEGRVACELGPPPHLHEAKVLMLDSMKARLMLGWQPRWHLEQALAAVVDWYAAYDRREALRDVVMKQIISYEATKAAR